MGDSRRPLYVLAVACSLNIVLDLLLVVVFQMGVAGAATATIFCQGISACIVTWMLMSKEKMCSLRLKKIRFYMNSLRSVVRIGIPAGFEAAMYCVANIVIQVFVNRLGTDYVAAWGNVWQDRRCVLDDRQTHSGFPSPPLWDRITAPARSGE